MMKFYLSYWTNNRSEDEKQGSLSIGSHINYFNLPKSWIPLGASQKEIINIKKEYDYRIKYKLTRSTVGALKNNYKEVYLITDYAGEKIFKDVGFSKILPFLEDLPKEYSEIWSLGKIKAYNMISQLGDPFFHIDYDFIIKNKLPEHIHNIPILAQSIETRLSQFKYCLDVIGAVLPQKYLYNISKPEIAYNMGITGGNDLQFFYDYSKSALDMVFDYNNKTFWLTPWSKFPCFTYWSKATFVEQYYYAVCLEYYKKKSECLINLICPEVLDQFQEYSNRKLDCYNKTKIVHLHGNMKADPVALCKIFPEQGYEIFY